MGSRRDSRSRSFIVTTVDPIGADGVDLFDDLTKVPVTALAAAANTRLSKDVVARRLGGAKLTSFATALTSITFGATTKYATYTPPLIPKGGFAVLVSFTAVRPSAGNTAYIVGARPSGQTFHVLKVTLSDAGVPTVTWRDSGGADRTVSGSAITAAASTNLLAIYDAVAGTFTLYVNGASSGTPLSGLSSTLQPDQTTGVVWTFAVEKQTGAAVTANSNFDGKVDQFVLFTLRGTRPASGSAPLASALLAHSSTRWPTPGMDACLIAFDMTNVSGTTLYDQSYNANNATLVGTPTTGTSLVAYGTNPGNVCILIQSPDGTRTNLLAAGGASYYEVVG